ncbi:MAG TPA: glycerophosphodiester phosphodiesterase [Acidimicrobiia bacterium]|nr:glycerophosphodiester phosphodiesterase [Acidimicrobiia bacterium]
MPIGFAHRGARLEEPENTLPAFHRALDAGAGGLETDAWLSADGEVVLVHDGVVGRGLRRRRVAELTAAQLAERDIPRLVDLYDQLGTAFELSVDAKVPEVASTLVEVATAYGAAERLWVCSPAVEVLVGIRDRGARLVHSPPFRRLVTESLERHAANLAAIGVDAINFHHTEWTAGLVSLFHRFDRLAFAWDAQEVRHLRAVLQMGVDAVYCDRPDRLVATIGEWTADAERD